jgi:hypothetical protein
MVEFKVKNKPEMKMHLFSYKNYFFAMKARFFFFEKVLIKKTTKNMLCHSSVGLEVWFK